MQSRERVIRALRFQRPDRAPRDLWLLPGVSMYRQAEVEALSGRFPRDLAAPIATYGEGDRARGTPNVVGTYVDAWGCVWHVAEPGVIGEVKGPPLADWQALATYRPPFEVLERADLSQVDDSCARSQRFMLAASLVRPFERMQFLRGSESLLADLAYAPRELYTLRDMVHEFELRDLAQWCATAVDGISFMDDWGGMRGLLISPQTWREFFRPLYAEYCRLIHQAGKFAFFHSDGNIQAIIPDLIACGVDALNSQLFCMDIEAIARQHRGQTTFWGEIDRQHILPTGSRDAVRRAVGRVRRALDTGQGGLIAQCEWGNDVSAETVAAVFEAWLEPVEALPPWEA